MRKPSHPQSRRQNLMPLPSRKHVDSLIIDSPVMIVLSVSCLIGTGLRFVCAAYCFQKTLPPLENPLVAEQSSFLPPPLQTAQLPNSPPPRTPPVMVPLALSSIIIHDNNIRIISVQDF